MATSHNKLKIEGLIKLFDHVKDMSPPLRKQFLDALHPDVRRAISLLVALSKSRDDVSEILEALAYSFDGTENNDYFAQTIDSIDKCFRFLLDFITNTPRECFDLSSADTSYSPDDSMNHFQQLAINNTDQLASTPLNIGHTRMALSVENNNEPAPKKRKIDAISSSFVTLENAIVADGSIDLQSEHDQLTIEGDINQMNYVLEHQSGDPNFGHSQAQNEWNVPLPASFPPNSQVTLQPISPVPEIPPNHPKKTKAWEYKELADKNFQAIQSTDEEIYWDCNYEYSPKNNPGQTIDALVIDAAKFRERKGKDIAKFKDLLAKNLKNTIKNIITTCEEDKVIAYVCEGAVKNANNSNHLLSPFRPCVPYDPPLDQISHYFHKIGSNVLKNNKLNLARLNDYKFKNNNNDDRLCWENICEMLKQYSSIDMVPLEIVKWLIRRFGGLPSLLTSIQSFFHSSVCKYYFGRISAMEAERILEARKQPKSFILRDPSEVNGTPYLFAISYFYDDFMTVGIGHMKVTFTSGMFTIPIKNETDQTSVASFKSVVDLLSSLDNIELKKGIASNLLWKEIDPNTLIQDMQTPEIYFPGQLRMPVNDPAEILEINHYSMMMQ